MIIGAGTIAMALVTRYELGVVKALPMRVHLGVDILAGLFLAASPWMFGFADRVWIPHLVFGLLEIGAALLTRVGPAGRATPA